MTAINAAAFLSPLPLNPKSSPSSSICNTAPRRQKHFTSAVAAPSHPFAPDPFNNPSQSPVFNPLPNRHLVANPSLPANPYRLTVVTSESHRLETIFASVRDIISRTQGAVREWRALSSTALDASAVLPSTIDLDAFRTQLYRTGRHLAADIIVQEESLARSPKRLAVFDLDSTLIAQETIDELASELNVQNKVKAITDRAMNGEIAFRDALSERVSLLKGLPLKALDGVKNRVVFTPGAAELIRALKAMGCQTAVVSGGFHFLADHVREVLNLDYAFANRLEVDKQHVLTGRTVGEVVDAEYKERTLQMLAKRLNLDAEQVLAVGDGSNDLLMMHRAGLGVAFNAKPSVQDRAKFRINQRSLVDVLYLLGLSHEQIQQLIGTGHSRLAKS